MCKMSKNTNRAKLNKAITNSDYRKILLMELYPPYYDEGYTWRHGDLPNHKWREWRTWKYNRKTQYKIK